MTISAPPPPGTRIPWIETPLVSNVFLKLENLQPAASFKSRGIGNFVLSKLAAATAAAQAGAAAAPGGAPPRPHFYCSSGGNAGLACVHAAVTLGCDATVVVPLSTPDSTVGKLRQAGAARVLRLGASWQEADDYLTQTLMADARAAGQAPVYVPPFDAPEVWDGNAGIVREIARQLPLLREPAPRLDAVVCSVGGGGLLCGIVQGLDELGLSRTKVVAVETEGADSLAQAVAAGGLVTLPCISSLATSLGARRVCQQALDYAARGSVANLVLSDAEAAAACRRFLDEERLLVELACAVCPAVCYAGKLADAVPGLTEDSVVVVVVCGGSNVSWDMVAKYVADEADAAQT
ncbi:uncharacterized protein UV8b_05893 [Ustilaginoidea virens]|uniref:L-serine ammonia-lyase n=1 Tax=Ustilaginoidea virens TaxID=1159556 RepID=A0A8E5HU41_USTVR|nr:uncharacterized protein UV8b_05893 [Ustilaginoidea virens]QUC21650.1 hypothetical protein UV8b_05893 [Ustilaginoidea virens]